MLFTSFNQELTNGDFHELGQATLWAIEELDSEASCCADHAEAIQHEIDGYPRPSDLDWNRPVQKLVARQVELLQCERDATDRRLVELGGDRIELCSELEFHQSLEAAYGEDRFCIVPFDDGGDDDPSGAGALRLPRAA